MVEVEGHVFISYVREDSDAVGRIARFLEAGGIPVWRDVSELWPGEDWKLRIREVIVDESLVFVACFSDNSAAKKVSYQREELLLAVDEFRKRAPGSAWFIPIRLTDCKLPFYELGAGRTLDSLNWLDLMISDDWDEGLARLMGGVLRVLGRSEAGSSSPHGGRDLNSTVRDLLLDDRRQIELEAEVRKVTNDAYAVITDRERFPSQSDRFTGGPDGLRFVLDQANNYWSAVEESRDVLMIGCAWGRPEHNDHWTRLIERIANTVVIEGGQTALTDLRWYPTTILLYAGGIAAMHRRNFEALKAITVNAHSRQEHYQNPVVVVGQSWMPFAQITETAQLLAIQSDGQEITDEVLASVLTASRPKRFTPVSDHLHRSLREPARLIIDDESDYTRTFDRLEVMIALLVSDERRVADQARCVPGPFYGAYTWRQEYREVGPDREMQAEFQTSAGSWPPLQAGLFDGDRERATAAFDEVIAGSDESRQRPW